MGNAPEAAGLEIQFLGPTLRFESEAAIALTGAVMTPTLDGAPLPQWESVRVPAGAVLETGFARTGARAYLAVAGGIETAPVLGSRSTFHMAGVGGMEGHALREGQRLPLGAGDGTAGLRVKADCRPPIPEGKAWEIEVVAAPTTTGSTRPAGAPSWRATGRCRPAATAPATASPARSGASPPAPPRRGRSTASTPPTSSITAIPWAR